MAGTWFRAAQNARDKLCSLLALDFASLSVEPPSRNISNVWT